MAFRFDFAFGALGASLQTSCRFCRVVPNSFPFLRVAFRSHARKFDWAEFARRHGRAHFVFAFFHFVEVVAMLAQCVGCWLRSC